MIHKEVPEYEIAVIGAGMAGMAAALFAANRGLSVVQVGGPGGISFSSGLLDLMGVHPVEEGRLWKDPWAGLDALKSDIPGHPLARIEARDIRAAIEEYTGFLDEEGFPYSSLLDQNVQMVTPLGTVKPSYAVPRTMWKGVQALKEKRPCLFVDFQGLKEFNANQVVSALQAIWPRIRSVRVSFPGSENTSRVFTRPMAQQMELREVREQLARLVRLHVREGETVGMPAVFGFRRSHEIVAKFEEEIGSSLFEIPTLPASIPGLRIKEAFESGLQRRGVRPYWQVKVAGVGREADGTFMIRLENGFARHEIRARGLVLATGRFFGKGLYAGRDRVRETLFDLPVHQPRARAQWHHRDFMDPRGHPINRAGLEVDDFFRPLDATGRPAHEALFASGSILAHQDWMRMKCGSGLAIATSFAAVKSYLLTRPSRNRIPTPSPRPSPKGRGI